MRLAIDNRVSTYGIINAVNICANGFDRGISPLECSAPDQLGLDGFKYSFYHCIIVAVSLAAHGGNNVGRFKDFSIRITGILASPV